jgi:magnesium-transporting ATPase (P-type)
MSILPLLLCLSTVAAYASSVRSSSRTTYPSFGTSSSGSSSSAKINRLRSTGEISLSRRTRASSTINPHLLHLVRGGGDDGGSSSSSVSVASLPPTEIRHEKSLSQLNGTPQQNDNFMNITNFNFSSTPITKILEVFQLTPNILQTGLTSERSAFLLQQYGPNTLIQPPGKSLLQLFKEQFEDGLVQILLVVAIVSGIFSFMEVASSDVSSSLLKAFVEPIIITAILVLNAIVGVLQSASAQESLDALSKLQATTATVLRDSKWLSNVDASTLVPGDIISLKVGDAVPADSRLIHIQTSTFAVDEGSLTGESVTTQKLPGDEGTTPSPSDPASTIPLQDQHGMIFTGTMVTSGTGTGLVCRTGMNTEFGKVRRDILLIRCRLDSPCIIYLSIF